LHSLSSIALSAQAFAAAPSIVAAGLAQLVAARVAIADPKHGERVPWVGSRFDSESASAGRREHERHRDVVAILPIDLGAPGMNAFNDEADAFVETPCPHIVREHVKFDSLDPASARPCQGRLNQAPPNPTVLQQRRPVHPPAPLELF
jgi:hypothetical protein